MEKLDLIIDRINKLISELPENTIKYELNLLFKEYNEIVFKMRKEVNKLCPKKLLKKV